MVQRTMENGLVTAQSLAAALTGLKSTGNQDRNQWMAIVEETLHKNVDFSGTWGAIPFDGLGR